MKSAAIRRSPPRSRAASSILRAVIPESFNVYGEKATFEWEQIEDEPPVIFRMKPVVTQWGRGNDITR